MDAEGPTRDGAERAPPASATRVLVAEDEPVARRMLEGLLANWDYGPVPVVDGIEAWDRLRSDPALRIALLDWMMPGLDGLAVIERLRSSPSTREIPVVLISGKADRASILRASECGAKAHLPKPFGQAELRRTVARWARPRAASRSRDR